MAGILRTVILVLIALWLIGLIFKVGGALIHILLLVAGIIFVFQLITGKRKL